MYYFVRKLPSKNARKKEGEEVSLLLTSVAVSWRQPIENVESRFVLCADLLAGCFLDHFLGHDGVPECDPILADLARIEFYLHATDDVPGDAELFHVRLDESVGIRRGIFQLEGVARLLVEVLFCIRQDLDVVLSQFTLDEFSGEFVDELDQFLMPECLSGSFPLSVFPVLGRHQEILGCVGDLCGFRGLRRLHLRGNSLGNGLSNLRSWLLSDLRGLAHCSTLITILQTRSTYNKVVSQKSQPCQIGWGGIADTKIYKGAHRFIITRGAKNGNQYA